MSGKVVMYRDAEGKGRWHRAEGGNVTADSGQGYTSDEHLREQAEAAMQPGDELVDHLDTNGEDAEG